MTIGDVVLLRASDEATAPAPRLLDHEARHSAQYALWLGPARLPAGVPRRAVWSWWRSGDFALRNPFEMRAGLADGGYVRPPAGGLTAGQFE